MWTNRSPYTPYLDFNQFNIVWETSLAVKLLNCKIVEHHLWFRLIEIAEASSWLIILGDLVVALDEGHHVTGPRDPWN